MLLRYKTRNDYRDSHVYNIYFRFSLVLITYYLFSNQLFEQEQIFILEQSKSVRVKKYRNNHIHIFENTNSFLAKGSYL